MIIKKVKGYLNNKEATDDCITPDGWFKTGDVAIMKDNFFWIVDRKKELIKYKGFQVPPAELEATLLSSMSAEAGAASALAFFGALAAVSPPFACSPWPPIETIFRIVCCWR